LILFQILRDYHEAILGGLWMTLKLSLVIWSSGLIVGTLVGIASDKWRKGVGVPLRFGSFVLSGLPVLVLLFWLHYPLQSMLGIVVDPFYTAATALSLVNAVLVAEVVKATLRDFPHQYLIAAQVCGLSGRDTIMLIQIPIILRQMLPGLLMIQVTMLQSTLFASLISVDEIFRVAQRINAMVYRPVEVYTALGGFFLAICLPLNGLALYLRRRYTRDLSET
jgi:His/Glu/Gln/Arg/opine family amino acid ABC transporter permease subunit